MIDFKDLKQKLRANVSKRRYRHSVGVSELARKLAKTHGWDPNKAEQAGLLHDWAKEWKPRNLITYVRRHNLAVPNVDHIIQYAPNMLHGFVGADVLKRKKLVTDRAVLKAIRNHTLGHTTMNLSDKIVYVADCASPDRKFKEAAKIRKLAMDDLEQGFAAAIAYKIGSNIRRFKLIHPYSIKVWNYFLQA